MIGATCARMIADGASSYEPILAVRHNHAKTNVIFFRDRKPVVTYFKAHSTLDHSGQPKGRGRHVKNRVVPRRTDGRITAWKIAFRADAGDRPYMTLEVGFPPREADGCEEGGGAHYTFGIERRRNR